MAQEWQTGKPPNETPVEVEWKCDVITVEAFYGRDGYRPHWRTKDVGTCWDVSAFKRWRLVSPNEKLIDSRPKTTDHEKH